MTHKFCWNIKKSLNLSKLSWSQISDIEFNKNDYFGDISIIYIRTSYSLISLTMDRIICQSKTSPHHFTCISKFNDEIEIILFSLSSSGLQFRLELRRLSGEPIVDVIMRWQWGEIILCRKVPVICLSTT